MSEELIVRHCSPTLAGIKTGSLFSCDCDSKEELFAEIRNINKKLVPKGLRVLPMRVNNNRALIYLCRPSSLEKDLGDQQASEILEHRGYPLNKTAQCITRLVERLQTGEEFPHEVGLFLGYPPEDVCAFIQNRGCAPKCVGCWKVYGDEDAAKQLFEKYKNCTSVYCAQWEKGETIERLAVAG